MCVYIYNIKFGEHAPKGIACYDFNNFIVFNVAPPSDQGNQGNLMLERL